MSPAIPYAGKIGESKTIWVNLWLGEDVHTKRGGVPYPTLRSVVPLVYGVGQVNFEST